MTELSRQDSADDRAISGTTIYSGITQYTCNVLFITVALAYVTVLNTLSLHYRLQFQRNWHFIFPFVALCTCVVRWHDLVVWECKKAFHPQIFHPHCGCRSLPQLQTLYKTPHGSPLFKTTQVNSILWFKIWEVKYKIPLIKWIKIFHKTGLIFNCQLSQQS